MTPGALANWRPNIDNQPIMPVQRWSEGILVVDLGDEPQFSEDIQSLDEAIDRSGPRCVVMNMAGVKYLSSTSLAHLLRMRKKLTKSQKQMRICSVPNAVWGVMLVTGLDKLFEFSPDVPSALAALQLET